MNHRTLKILHQVPHSNAQSLRDFYQIIHRRRFDSPFNPADENRREVRVFSQFLLAESSFFPSGPDGLAQQTPVLLNGRHGGFKEQEPPKAAMSLTTRFCSGFGLQSGGKRFKRAGGVEDAFG
jgi:hypothetical protein